MTINQEKPSGFGRLMAAILYRQVPELEQQLDLGYIDGADAGSRIVTAQVSDSDVCRIVLGYWRSEPDVLAMVTSPRTGLHQDDPTAAQLVRAYDAGYRDGAWDAILRSCRVRMEKLQ